MRVALLVLLAGCQASVGTLSISLATAPGSTVLDDVQTLKLVITDPHTVAMAPRTNGGFAIEVDLDATGTAAQLIVDGLDASGALVATGSTPTLPIGALDAHIVVYMAAPNSIALAPLSIDPPREAIAVAPLPYGAVLAGGVTAAGTSDAIAIYNAFDHTLSSGVAMPAARSGLALTTAGSERVYLYGGRDANGTDTATMWQFDTSVAPAGAFADLGDKGFARSDAAAVAIGSETLLVTGMPPLELNGNGAVNARGDAPNGELGSSAASVVGSDGIATAIFVGPDGVVRFRTNAFDTLAVPAPATTTAFGALALPGGRALALYDDSGFVIDVAAGTFMPSAIVAPAGGGVAATPRHVIVVDGTNAMATIYDAVTLAAIATQPLAGPRIDPAVVALPNGQVLIAGGHDASLAPVGTLELFTPEPTE